MTDGIPPYLYKEANLERYHWEYSCGNIPVQCASFVRLQRPFTCLINLASPTTKSNFDICHAVSTQGWLYTPFDTVARTWVTIASGPTAKVTETPITTKWDGGDQNLECFEYHATADITSGDNVEIESRKRRVIKCLFDGYHGSWLPNDNGEELTWWFFKQFVPK